MKARMGAPKAITATAHTLARLIDSMLKHGTASGRQGMDEYEQQDRDRTVKTLPRRAKTFGYTLVKTSEGTSEGALASPSRPGSSSLEGAGAHCCRLNPGKLLFQPPLNMPHVIRLLHAQPQSWPVASQLPKPQRHFRGHRMCTG
jgi:hypothetical protein